MGSYWDEMAIYKHENNTDVAIEVLKQFYVKEKDLWKLKVMWWNISTKRPPMRMDIAQSIEIPHAKKKEWRKYTYD